MNIEETLRILKIIHSKIFPSKVAHSYTLAKEVLHHAIHCIESYKPDYKTEGINLELGRIQCGNFVSGEHLVFTFRWFFKDSGALAKGVVSIFQAKGLDAWFDPSCTLNTYNHMGHLTVVVNKDDKQDAN